MLGIKKLDRFILKSFALLFAGTFFICLFIFMMQFLWRYVDELVGKGLELSLMAQFFFYSGLTLVPLSLPLAILLASLITFGNFGERYELLAMKAAGISLLQIMRPLIVFCLLLGGVSFYFQNVIAPQAQVKLWTLLISMRQKSPELDIPEGVFYNEIPDYNLYVKHKNRDTGWMHQLMIYNFSDGFENARIIVADSGYLETTADKKHLFLHLYSGEQFENLKAQTGTARNVPYYRESFAEKHSLIEFDANFNMVDAGFMSDQSMSKDMVQLQHSIDSMRTKVDSIGRRYYTDSRPLYTASTLSVADSARIAESRQPSLNADSAYQNLSLLDKKKVLSSALSSSESASGDWAFKSFMVTDGEKRIRKHETEWHNKITLSLACLIFFFIGAPLGAIIRKGGLGMPVVVSVLIFIIYYIINNTGYKMARDGNWEVWQGMWISTFILAPVGAFFTYKSNIDSAVFNADLYRSWLRRLVGIRPLRHLVRKEVILQDPDYEQDARTLDDLTRACEDFRRTHRLRHAPNYIRLWQRTGRDHDMEYINNQLEALVEDLANTSDRDILNRLNEYPILTTDAHQSPFSSRWANRLAGWLMPLGLTLYVRIWMYRIRLDKDLKQIIETNQQILNFINKILHHGNNQTG